MQIEIIYMLLPVIIGLVATARKIGLSTRFAPLLGVLLGAGFGVWMTHSLSFAAVLPGIVTGLASVGLYASTKTTVNG